eukprot:6609182-Alexandrium_andersonii.AAC.1
MELALDQLSAVSRLIEPGVPPYVDFSLFGPHGHRRLKKLMFAAFTYLQESGAYQRQELPGPPSFEARWKCWTAWRATLLLLEQCNP